MTHRETEWIEILRADAKATGSVTATALRVGVSRGAISAILNGTASSPYVNGKSSTEQIQTKVMNTIGRIVCPFLSDLHGAEHRITGLECRDTHNRERAPTNSPRAMAHWRACQSCEKRVATAQPDFELKPLRQRVRRSDAKEVEPKQKPQKPQQAGVVDKVTWALPEVGEPMVAETTTQGESQ